MPVASHEPISQNRIRPGKPADLDALLELENRCFTTDRLSRRSMRHFLVSPSATLTVAEEGGKLSGYAWCCSRRGLDRRGFIPSRSPPIAAEGSGRIFSPRPRRRRRGARRRAMRLEVHEHNTRAIARYEKSGYRLFGRHRDYYDDHGDALRFEKPLMTVRCRTPSQARAGLHPARESILMVDIVYRVVAKCHAKCHIWGYQNCCAVPDVDRMNSALPSPAVCCLERDPSMTGWVILVDQPRDLPNAETPHKVITTSEYLARPRLFDMGRPKLVNLARSYAYQSKGYYASLLAEARGHRVVPTVETMLELREQKLYEHALPELEDDLNRCARRADFQPEGQFKLMVCFGIARDTRFESFGRLLFDWFRCPALEVIVDPGGLAFDRPHPAAQHHPACQRRRRSSSASRCTSTPSASGATPRRAASPSTTSPCFTIRNEKMAPSSPSHASSTSRASPRRFASMSSRSPSATGRARRVRRSVHPRDHVDRQPHLSLRPPRLAGRHAGHRRSDLDDPLHQQGLS